MDTVNNEQSAIRVLTILETRARTLSGAVRSVRFGQTALEQENIELIMVGSGSIGELVMSYRQLKKLRGRYDIVLINGLRPLSESRSVRWFARRSLRRGVPVAVYWHETEWSFKDMDEIAGGNLSATSSVLRDPNVKHLVTSKAAAIFTREKVHQDSLILPVYECVPDPQSMSWLSQVSLQLPENRPLVLVTASINARKGNDLFVEACRLVKAERPDTLFAWSGIGLAKDEQAMRSQIEQAGLTDDFMMLGYQDPPYLWQKAAFVIAMPSRNDPQPLAAHEGLAAGRPVVCFDVDGLPEVLGEGGTVIKPYDTQAFAQAIIHWLDQMAKTQIHPPARTVYEKYSQPQAFAGRFAQAIRQCCDGSK